MTIKAQTLSKLAVSAVVSPLAVVGTSLQLSITSNKEFYGAPGKAVSKLLLSRDYQVMIKEKRFNELQLAGGMTKHNRPFRAPIYENYREAIKGLAGQGYQGFYKGNFISLLHSAILFSVATHLNSGVGLMSAGPGLTTIALGTATLSIAEIASQPLRVCQTRFILQNRLPLFRVYRSVYYFFVNTKSWELKAGWRVIVPRNMLFASPFMLQPFIAPSVTPLFSLLIGYTLSYPFLTIQRRLEAISDTHSMLPRRYKHATMAMSTIWREEGRRGFYRGFAANSLAYFIGFATLPLLTKFISEQADFQRYYRLAWRHY